jgi:hypothetical protein
VKLQIHAGLPDAGETATPPIWSFSALRRSLPRASTESTS